MPCVIRQGALGGCFLFAGGCFSAWWWVWLRLCTGFPGGRQRFFGLLFSKITNGMAKVAGDPVMREGAVNKNFYGSEPESGARYTVYGCRIFRRLVTRTGKKS